MKIRLPSLRIQFLFLVQFVLIISVLFYRFFFIQNFEKYENQIASLGVEDRLRSVYQEYKDQIDLDYLESFKMDMDTLMVATRQSRWGAANFESEMELYSIYILTSIIIAVFIFTVFTFRMITKPLENLQQATHTLSQGNLRINVPESKYSPLNELIISFNSMVRELETSRDKLITAEKDTVWREMARVMAHEIKNPLTPLQLTAERLEIKFLESPEALIRILPKSLEVIKEEIAGLKRLTVEFSEFARLPESKPVEFDLIKLVEEVTIPYQPNAKINFSTGGELCIFADKFQIRQVLVNLIQNGIQASGSDPIISIFTKLHEDNYIHVSVADEGRGIPEDEISRIFEPYFSKRKKGTGLGLAIVKKIIEQHYGQITVTSQVDVGTTFIIKLPVYHC
ncbi:MAG: HAMP domain-containing protein [Candidatus Marinimicrobia bacterium]|nr:HAMP domain-containing protein [Candidatus Neomarinimicrobiota bacterium]